MRQVGHCLRSSAAPALVFLFAVQFAEPVLGDAAVQFKEFIHDGGVKSG